MSNHAVRWYIVLSVAAALLLALFAWTEAGRGSELAVADRLLFGSVLATCCLFGLARSVRPGVFRTMEAKRTASSAKPSGGRPRVGHHPDCDRFAAHLIILGGTKRCAGCTGLAIGSIIGLGLVATYLLADSISRNLGGWMLLLGPVVVAVAIVETATRRCSSGVHVTSNSLLVLGFVTTTIGATEFSGSVYVGLLAVLFSFLWLDTRIATSRTVHARTCSLCPLGCKSY